ncbi:MAG: response regulator [Deltaproteobacteria bacterium]|nr:MAG: response regulator [Deltaproteobacteria bacterium]
MSLLTITSALYADGEVVVEKLAEKMNCRVFTDEDLITMTESASGIKYATLKKVAETQHLAFNEFTHEKEKCIASLRKTVSDVIAEGDAILHGVLGHLIPDWTTHVLRVLIISDAHWREENAVSRYGISRTDAHSRIKAADAAAALWINDLHHKKMWDPTLYDIVIPSDKSDADTSVQLIIENAGKLPAASSDIVSGERRDFSLAAAVGVALCGVGQALEIQSNDGHVTLTLNKNVMMLNRFKQKLSTLAMGVDGVRSVEIRLGKDFYKTNVLHSYDFDAPLQALLVDDEKEFVQTLSERLKMRAVETDVVFSGEEALDFTAREDTEVMVLDLKMPGINGIDVLKKVKETRPEIEVIILTAHGTDADRDTCMALGAFAYLRKPADIDQLASTMRAAYKKARARNA